jgi:hypothetical protein
MTKDEVPRHHQPPPVNSTTVTPISLCCKYKKGCISVKRGCCGGPDIEEKTK